MQHAQFLPVYHVLHAQLLKEAEAPLRYEWRLASHMLQTLSQLSAPEALKN